MTAERQVAVAGSGRSQVVVSACAPSVPFAIAGIQMYLGHGSNVDAMRHRVDLTMHLYPWVQMVMFSELAVFGPMLQHAQPLPGTVEETFQQMALRRCWSSSLRMI